MRGIWWHSYTTTVNTFLYDEPPKTTLTSFLGSKTKTAVDLMHANAWSSKDQGFQGGTSPAEDETAVKDYTANRKNSFKYVFNFDKIDGSSEYNWAHVMPSIYGQESPSKMFAMYATDVCANCREQSASNNPKAGSAHARTVMSKSLTGAQTKAQTCQDFETASGNTEPAQDQCWRRISNLAFGDIKTGDKSVPTIGFSYDVIKIVDQYGDKIQPNFDNWVAALRKINRDYIVLPTGDCTDTAEVHEAPKTIDWQKSYRGPFAHQDDEKSTDDEYVYDDEATGTDNEYTTDEEATGTDEEDANDEETTGTDEEDTNDDETTGTDEEDTSDDDTRAHRLRGGAR